MVRSARAKFDMSPAGSNLFRRVFFIFERGFSFSGFPFSFSGFPLVLFSESAESVAPITFCQLSGSAKHTPYLSTTGTSPRWPGARTNQSLPSRATDVAPNLPTRKRPTASGESELTPGLEPEFHGSVQQKGQSTALEIRLRPFQPVMARSVRSCFL